MKKFIFAVVSILLLIPLVTYAAVGSDTIVIEDSEVIDANIFRAGEVITIDGTVHGDVFVAGGTVTINGTVGGDVIGVAGSLVVNGDVAGNIRAAAGSLEIDGSVGRNATIFGGDITVGDEADIGWSLVTGAGTTTIDGTIRGHVQSYGGTVAIGGNIGGDMRATLEEQGVLTVRSTAVIDGDLEYRSERTAAISDAATISGTISQQLPTHDLDKAQSVMSSVWLFGKLMGLFAILFVGVLLVSLFPEFMRRISVVDVVNQGRAIITGVLALILTPVIMILLLISIIGAPAALILGALYLILIYLSKVIVGIALGVYIFRRLQGQKQSKPIALFWPMMLGTTIVYILTLIPFFGWALGAVCTIWVMGICIEYFRTSGKQS